MNNKKLTVFLTNGSRIAILFILILTSAGCATVNDYEKFSQVGIEYSKAIDKLLVVTLNRAIDATSSEIISENKFANRNKRGFKQQENTRLERSNDKDLKRIAVFKEIQKHTKYLKKYFFLLNKLATSDEPEKTVKAMNTVAASIQESTDILFNQKTFLLDEKSKKRINAVLEFVLKVKIRSILRTRLKNDQKLLQRTLQTHAELFNAIEADLMHSMRILRQNETKMLLLRPLLSQKPLALNASQTKKWIDNRRRILLTEATIGELKTARRSAAKLKKGLKKLLQGDGDFNNIMDSLLADLESIHNVIEAFKD